MVNLDLPPKERWSSIGKQYAAKTNVTLQYLRKMVIIYLSSLSPVALFLSASLHNPIDLAIAIDQGSARISYPIPLPLCATLSFNSLFFLQCTFLIFFFPTPLPLFLLPLLFSHQAGKGTVLHPVVEALKDAVIAGGGWSKDQLAELQGEHRKLLMTSLRLSEVIELSSNKQTCTSKQWKRMLSLVHVGVSVPFSAHLL